MLVMPMSVQYDVRASGTWDFPYRLLLLGAYDARSWLDGCLGLADELARSTRPDPGCSSRDWFDAFAVLVVRGLTRQAV